MSLRNPHELGVRLEVVDVETAVEMVDFVLQGTREEALALDAELAAVTIARLDRHLRGSRHLGDVAGNGQAPLPVDLLTRRLHDLRVHELGDPPLDLGHRHLQRHADLVRCEPDPGRVPHRHEHVVQQPMQPTVEARDALRALAQDRLVGDEDGTDLHGAPNCTDQSRDSGSTSMAIPGGTRSSATARVSASGARTTTWNR